jgi:peroxiredoxin
MRTVQISALLLCFAVLAISCEVRQKKKAEETPAAAEAAVNELPSLAITGPDNKTIITKALNKGKVILILFQPDCDHCQRETTAIVENVKAFEPYQVYYISSASQTDMHKFFIDYKLENLSNFHYASTTLENVLNALGPISAPSMYIYSNGKKVKHFNGETNISDILKVL